MRRTTNVRVYYIREKEKQYETIHERGLFAGHPDGENAVCGGVSAVI